MTLETSPSLSNTVGHSLLLVAARALRHLDIPLSFVFIPPQENQDVLTATRESRKRHKTRSFTSTFVLPLQSTLANHCSVFIHLAFTCTIHLSTLVVATETLNHPLPSPNQDSPRFQPIDCDEGWLIRCLYNRHLALHQFRHPYDRLGFLGDQSSAESFDQPHLSIEAESDGAVDPTDQTPLKRAAVQKECVCCQFIRLINHLRFRCRHYTCPHVFNDIPNIVSSPSFALTTDHCG
ncbi:hypothetical protein BLNAU_7444 [Blattamonas nauphoetae]|uniref:Uncharacterized protein n=1 Tax=Blattamonas nauphoetae TaxID=2049346 RepID=A0ABQ9Y1C5_9EUKA|nr:hypothetical protein BLNAU_7444 [Blattamonas nauphoetae]